MSNSHAKLGRLVHERALGLLTPAGWTVELEVLEPPWFQLRLDHPLSSQHIVSFDSRRPVYDVLAQVLEEPEFAIVAGGPSYARHASLIRALRQSARGFEWQEGVLEVVAQILGDCDVVDPEEAEWLRAAGPAWPPGHRRDG
jgi:hypothetical protein